MALEDLRTSADRAVGHADAMFRRVFLRVPRLLDGAELGFSQSVSWLYVHYFEAGQPSLRFVMDLMDAAGIDREPLDAHLGIVRDLRTSLQHNLDLTAERDVELDGRCADWYSRACDRRSPTGEEEWDLCTVRLLNDSTSTFHSLRESIRWIDTDAHRNVVLEQWRRVLRRHHDVWEYDRVIEVTANDLGHEHLDVRAFRDRHIASWRSSLEVLDEGYDFEFEARRRIEHSLLTDHRGVLPITGTDVMQRLGLPPGPAVGRALERASEIYKAERLTREALLTRLEGLDEV